MADEDAPPRSGRHPGVHRGRAGRAGKPPQHPLDGDLWRPDAAQHAPRVWQSRRHPARTGPGRRDPPATFWIADVLRRRRVPASARLPAVRDPGRDAARVVASHPEQGWSLLCNGVLGCRRPQEASCASISPPAGRARSRQGRRAGRRSTPGAGLEPAVQRRCGVRRRRADSPGRPGHRVPPGRTLGRRRRMSGNAARARGLGHGCGARGGWRRKMSRAMSSRAGSRPTRAPITDEQAASGGCWVTAWQSLARPSSMGRSGRSIRPSV